MGSARSVHGRDENTNRIFVGEPEGKRPLGDLGVDGSTNYNKY
jgi:hypothetical protein